MRKWQPTPVFLSGESHGQRSLAGYNPWGRKELDMTEHSHPHTHTHPHTHSPSSPCSQAPHLPSWLASGKSCFLITLFGKLSLIQTPTHVRFSLSHPSIFWSEKSSLSGLHTQVHAKWAEAWRRSWRRDPAAHWTACTLVSTTPCWHWEVVAPPGFAFSSIHPPGVRASLSHLPLQPGPLLWTLDTNISNCVFNISLWLRWDFPGGSDGKESACNIGDLGSIPGLGRSPGADNGNPLQSSCLGSPMDRGAWRATVHGVAKNLTQLSDYHFHFTFTLVEICVPTEFHPMKWRENAVVPSWTCSILTLSPQHIRSSCSPSFFPFLEMGITSRVTSKATRCIWHQSGSLNNDVEEDCLPTCSPAQGYYVIKKSSSNVLSTELWAKVFKVAN